MFVFSSLIVSVFNSHIHTLTTYFCFRSLRATGEAASHGSIELPHEKHAIGTHSHTPASPHLRHSTHHGLLMLIHCCIMCRCGQGRGGVSQGWPCPSHVPHPSYLSSLTKGRHGNVDDGHPFSCLQLLLLGFVIKNCVFSTSSAHDQPHLSFGSVFHQCPT